MSGQASYDGWIADLDAIASKATQAEGYSIEEIADAMKVASACARSRLKKALKAGLWKFAGRRATISSDQKKAWTPVYAPVRNRLEGKEANPVKKTNKARQRDS